jgi:hypothetical protein
MPLTKSEINTLRSIRKDAIALAKRASKVAIKAEKRLYREMKKS